MSRRNAATSAAINRQLKQEICYLPESFLLGDVVTPIGPLRLSLRSPNLPSHSAVISQATHAKKQTYN
jgi:hypothetical protein